MICIPHHYSFILKRCLLIGLEAAIHSHVCNCEGSSFKKLMPFSFLSSTCSIIPSFFSSSNSPLFFFPSISIIFYSVSLPCYLYKSLVSSVIESAHRKKERKKRRERYKVLQIFYNACCHQASSHR